jgi:hypothetical protein
MTELKPTITLPRLPNEHPARYEARTAYILMGADRSLEAVSQKLSKSVPLMKRWSSEDNWTELAANHDQTVYTLAAQAQSDEYQESLKAFRTKYGKTGDDLHKVASVMLATFAQQIQGKKIVDKDGKTHVLPGMEMNVSTLGQIKAALQTAADLEALALRVESLLNSEREETRD